MSSTILVIEDNFSVRNVIREFLDFMIIPNSAKVVTLDKVDEANEVIENENVSLVITDVNLGVGGDGLSLVDELNHRENRPYIVVMSSVEWLKKIENYLKSHMIDSFLNKPFSFKDLKSILKDSKAVSLK